MKDYPIQLGSMLFTLVEPRQGFTVEYNRWYERDHFYAGCMIGAYNFAGQRFVATRALKDMRSPQAPNPITPDPRIGSYLALYWILAGHHDEWNRWAVDQVNRLHAEGRMFAERDHIHTMLYNYEWAVGRDADGVPAELALDHRFPGLVVVVLDGKDDGAAMSTWYQDRERHLGATSALTLAFSPRPLLADAPEDVPRAADASGRLLVLHFLDSAPADLDRWRSLPSEVAHSGLGSVAWVAPFLPTIPGTDTYTDQL